MPTPPSPLNAACGSLAINPAIQAVSKAIEVNPNNIAPAGEIINAARLNKELNAVLPMALKNDNNGANMVDKLSNIFIIPSNNPPPGCFVLPSLFNFTAFPPPSTLNNSLCHFSLSLSFCFLKFFSILSCLDLATYSAFIRLCNLANTSATPSPFFIFPLWPSEILEYKAGSILPSLLPLVLSLI